eukprot:gene15896-24297_t
MPRCVVDTHVHLDMIVRRLGWSTRDLTASVGQLVATEVPKVGKVGLKGCVHVACSRTGLRDVRAVLDAGTGRFRIKAAVGIHPCNHSEWSPSVADELNSLLKGDPRVVAWGECGLDYHHAKSEDERQAQRAVLSEQLRCAAGHPGKAIVIHARRSEADCLRLLQEHVPRTAKIHVHCFTGRAAEALAFVAAFPNAKVGFTGVVTFNNARDVRAAVAALPLDKILTETDGPFMAPAPYRGAVAHPGHAAVVAESIASLKQVPLADALAQLERNAEDIYGAF